MFDRAYIRIWIATIWLFLFLSLWFSTEYLFLDKETLISNLNALQKNVENNEWIEASYNFKTFEENWEKKRLFVQINNGEATVSTFTEKLSQAKILVQNQKDDVLGTIGELKDLTSSIAVAFPGP